MEITQTLHERLVEMLTRLKLTAIRDQLDRLLGEAARADLALPEALALLCERELGRKHERRIEMGLSIAKFPAVRELATFDYKAQPSLDGKEIKELASSRWVGNGEAVLLLGPRRGEARLRHDASARRTSPSGSGARRSAPATACCSLRRRAWSPASPRRTPRAASRTGSCSWRNRNC